VESAGLALPVGQTTHVLRHTFASHFMMNAGNILMLQRILGHANVTMTMRYSHLSPEHLQEAKNLNPLSRLTLDCHPPMTNGFHRRATRLIHSAVLVAWGGIEPPTRGFSIRCSTN